MIKSRKLQLVIVLLLACICASVLGAETNEAKTEIKFDIRNDLPPAHHLMPRAGTHNVYSHFAVLFVRGGWVTYKRGVPIEAMLETTTGQSMSQLQCDIISNQSVRFMDDGSTISGYTYFQLFGVSKDDTKKMVNTFIEVLANRVDSRRQSLLNQQQKLKQKIAGVKKKILEKETELKDMENRLEEVKKKVHYLTADEAGNTIEELNKTLDELNIDIAGMQRKLFAISEEHEHMSKEAQKSGDVRKKIYETTIWPRLEQMRIDQIIELKVAEEKRSTAMKIRSEAEEFYHLHMQPVELQRYLSPLRRTLSSSQESLRNTDMRLTTPEFLSPKVFQNKVTIYSVRVED